MSELLTLSGVTKTFGGLVAVNDVSFTVEQGSIMGIIGPNGAGKTTVFNLITGNYTPDRGEILFRGQSLVGRKPRGHGHCPHVSVHPSVFFSARAGKRAGRTTLPYEVGYAGIHVPHAFPATRRGGCAGESHARTGFRRSCGLLR